MTDEKQMTPTAETEESTESQSLSMTEMEKVVGGTGGVAPGDEGEPGAGLPWADNHLGHGPPGAGE